jgi:hypothetical protein
MIFSGVRPEYFVQTPKEVLMIHEGSEESAAHRVSATFNMPWAAMRVFHRADEGPMVETICAEEQRKRFPAGSLSNPNGGQARPLGTWHRRNNKNF